jgi:protein LTV1
MGKKKPFITNSKARTYHLLHRSQRDVAEDVQQQQWQQQQLQKQEGGGGGAELLLQPGPAAAGRILWPVDEDEDDPHRRRRPPRPRGGQEQQPRSSSSSSSPSSMDAWRQRLREAGLLDEGEHDRYLREMTGEGPVLEARRGALAAVDRSSQPPPAEEEEVLEVQRQFDSIPLTTDCMDQDIAAALFQDWEEGEYEEIQDDFVLEAVKERPSDASKDDFDFDAHIQKLLAKASKQDRGERGGGGAYDLDNDFFEHARPLHERDDDHHDRTAVPKLTAEEERALCEKFHETLAEYDSDEVGDNPEEEILGPLPVQGDAVVEAALDDFLQEREDHVFMQGTTRRREGSSFAALVGTRMVPAKELDAASPDEAIVPVEEVLAEASDRLAQPPQQVPPEEILIDGQSYFSERPRNPFDCESILSTYSNLDNNPVTIQATRRRRPRQKKQVAPKQGEQEGEPIRLSSKTGLPLGAFPSKGDDPTLDGGTMLSVNRGEARNKQETAEEKKARKLQIKRERELARIQKKMTKEVFRDEFQKRSVVDVGGDVAGKSVFRFS